MKKIRDYIERINEELSDAKHYAEKYLLNKGWSQSWSRMYSEMATDELRHAGYIRQIAAEHIKMLGWIPDECRDAWDECEAHYPEKVAMVQLMLSK